MSTQRVPKFVGRLPRGAKKALDNYLKRKGLLLPKRISVKKHEDTNYVPPNQ